MSVQNYDWPSCKKLYVGKSGCGKTSLFWEHFRKEKARIKFLYDHKAMEFCRRYKLKPIFDQDTLLAETARIIEAGGGGVVPFVPMKLWPGEPEKGFGIFCDFVFNVCEQFRGRKLFGCDELQRLVDTRSQPKPLLQICDIGRTYQIDCFFIASASNTIHNLVKNQITECFAFLHGTKNACEWETEKGFDETELLTLKKLEWRWRNLDTGEARAGGKALQAHGKAD